MDTNVLYIVYGFLCVFIFIYDDCHGIICLLERTNVTFTSYYSDQHPLIQDAILSCKFAIVERYSWVGAALPGGHIEAHEGLVESVIREVKEETGLTIKNPKLVGMKHFTRQMTNVILFSSIELQTLKETFIRQKREKSVGLPGKMCLRWTWLMTCSICLRVFEEDQLSELFYRERLENDFVREFW